jgi:hypothetical protein
MAVTRIKNNQITDATINAAAKVTSYSITSGLLANSLTYGSDLTITGNLTVNGSSTTIDTVDLIVEDPIIILAANQTGAPSVDIGFIGKRGTSTNVAFVWDESVGAFLTAFTNTAATNTAITISSYADFQAANITSNTNLAVTGTTSLTGNITVGNLFVGTSKTINVGNNVITNVATPVGNSDAATKEYVDGIASSGFTIEDDTANTTVVSSGDTLELRGTANEVGVYITGVDQITFGLPDDVTVTATLTAGNLSTGGTANVTGNITGGNLSTAGQVSATGNVTAGNLITGGLISATGAITGGSTISAAGNVTAGNVLTGGLVSATGNVNGGNLISAALVQGVTVSASGNITGGNLISSVVTNSTAMTISTASGNLNLQPTGNIVLNSKYINGVNQPVQDNDAASKIYVDNMVSTQLAYHEAVLAATTGTLAAATGGTITYNNGTAGVGATLTVAGGTFNLIDTANVQTAGTRILVKNQADATQNGVYEYTSSTVITRTTDADTYGPNSATDLSINDYFFVQSGDVNKGSAYIVDAPSGVITFGTSNIEFAQFSSSQTYTANTSAGLVLNSTVFSAKVDNNTTAFDGGGNISIKVGANLTTPNIGAATGTSLSVTGNVDGGNLNTGAQVVATGNITGGNLITAGLATVTGNVNTSAGVLATGNVTGGNVNTAGLITATGNITGGNLITGGLITATGTITSTANIAGGNLTTGAQVSAGGNITGGNLITVGLTTVTGNITGGNLITGGLITATGNVDGGNVNAAGNVTGGNITTAGQANLGNIRISGDTITGTNGRVNINSAAADVDFSVSGTAANVFYIDAGTNSASFGNATQITNAIASFQTTTSIKVPVGTTGQRPGAGVTGMVRFNTSVNNLEFYDANSWQTAGSQFTVITANTQSGDGVQTAFTLPAASTTAGTIVAINGVVQIPVTAYSVANTTCTFTEAPVSTDVIDFRVLATTSTVTGLSSSSGAIVELNPTLIDVDLTGNIIPTSNVAYNLGNTTNRFNDLYLSGSSLYLGNVIMKTATGNTIAFFQPDGTTPATIAASSVDTTQIASGTSGVAVVSSGGNIRANVAGTTVQTISAGLVAITGDLSVTGNATLSGNILGDRVQNGTTSFDIQTPNGNANITVGGTSNVAVFATTGAFVTGVLSASGNVTGGNLSVSTGTITGGNIVNANGNGIGNIGSSSVYFNTVFAKATSAQYADLAEKYVADAEYAPGTVLAFGGDQEVTLATDAGSTRVAGVVSTNPSYIMNAGLTGEHVAMVALQGRVPCRVVGAVAKGDLMVAAGNGAAKADNTARAGTIIGKALENFDGAEGTIEVVIGRN